jgi:rieske iron-sulfur protein
MGYEKSDERSLVTEVNGPETAVPMNRRNVVKTFVGLGLASALTDCTPTSQGSAGEMPGPPPAQGPELESEPEAALSLDEHEHPTDGDVLVFALGARKGEVVTPADVPLDGPQIFVYAGDIDGAHSASASRFDQIVLLRLDPLNLTEETTVHAADGIVAYSAICTHEGCDVSDWSSENHRLICPCHDSEFDPTDNGQVTEGPARRRLAALPLKLVDSQLVVAGGFTGRVGFRNP